MNENQPKNFGLIPRLPSKLLPRTHQVFGTPSPLNLPPSYDVGDVIGPVDQGATRFCAEYTTRELCADIDKLPYDVNWNVAVTGKLAGAPIVNGTDPQTAMEAMVIFGLLHPEQCPQGYTWQEKGPDFISEWRNWPNDCFLKAAEHERKGFDLHLIDGPYDPFDDIRAQMYLHKRSAGMATQWYTHFNNPDSDGCIPTPDVLGGYSWHMYTAKGWDIVQGVPRLKVKPYEGAGYGKGGYSYFTREQVNFLAQNPMAHFLMFADSANKQTFINAFIERLIRYLNTKK